MQRNKYGITRRTYGVDSDRNKYDIGCAIKHLTAIGRQVDQNFVIDEHNSEFYHQLVYYFHGDHRFFDGDLTKGILITGAPGTGKTFALKLFNIYRNVDNISFFINDAIIPLRYDIVRSRELVSDFTVNGWEGKAISVAARKVVCIDDIGEEDNVMHYGNSVNLIQEIIERRSNQFGITFLITNLQVKELRERYGERFFSRMYKMFNFMTLKGNDRRKSIAK